MKRNVKKVVSVVVASSMLLSLAACADKAKDEVLEAVDSFAANLVKQDAKKVFKATNIEDEDDQEELTALFVYDDDAIRDAIASAITYEVDEESVEASTKDAEGSVDVIFTVPDYESVFEDTEAADEDELIDELEDADTTEIKVTIEFEKDEDTWVVTNADKVIDKVYGGIYDVELPTFGPNYTAADFEADWYWEDEQVGQNAYYTNTNEIDMDLRYIGPDADYDYTEFYYTVTLNNEVIFTSETGIYMGYWNAYYGAELNENGYLDAGDYTITFYAGNGNVICEGIAYVTEEEAPAYTAADFEPNWYFEDEDNGSTALYDNATSVDMDLRYLGNGSLNYSDIYYTVSVDGTVIYTSDVGTYEGYWTVSRGAESVNGYVAPGAYTITFYQGTTQLCQGTAIVTVDGEGAGEVPSTPSTPSTPATPGSFTDTIAEFENADFQNSVIDCCWYNPDTRYMLDSFMYDSGVSYVSYSIEVSEDVTDSIYYAYYFSADGEEPDIENDEPIFSATITPTSYTDGTYYDIDCNQGTDGGYLLIIAEDSSLENPYLATACFVGAVG